jgi:hypothetical protein
MTAQLGLKTYDAAGGQMLFSGKRIYRSLSAGAYTLKFNGNILVEEESP